MDDSEEKNKREYGSIKDNGLSSTISGYLRLNLKILQKLSRLYFAMCRPFYVIYYLFLSALFEFWVSIWLKNYPIGLVLSHVTQNIDAFM